jgi:hypothetical protein
LFVYDLTLLLLPVLVLGLVVAAGNLRSGRCLLMGLIALYATPCASGALAALTGLQLTVLVMTAVLVITARGCATELERPTKIRAHLHTQFG